MTDQVKTCGRGHALTPDNLIKRGDRPSQRCKRCSRIKDQMYRDRQRKRGCEHGVTPASSCIECQMAIEYQKNATEPSVMAAEASGEKALPTDYLRPSESQAAALKSVDFKVDKNGRPLCERPEVRRNSEGKLYDYYAHMDWVKDEGTSHPPSAVESMKMCVGCPIMQQCARVQKEFGYDGTWAGISYLGGKPVNN